MRDPITGTPVSHPELCLHHLGAELAAAWAEARTNPSSPIARVVLAELGWDTARHLKAAGWHLANTQTLGSLAQLAQTEIRLARPEHPEQVHRLN